MSDMFWENKIRRTSRCVMPRRFHKYLYDTCSTQLHVLRPLPGVSRGWRLSGRPDRHLGLIKACRDHSRAILAPNWHHLGPSWPLFGLSWTTLAANYLLNFTVGHLMPKRTAPKLCLASFVAGAAPAVKLISWCVPTMALAKVRSTSAPVATCAEHGKFNLHGHKTTTKKLPRHS